MKKTRGAVVLLETRNTEDPLGNGRGYRSRLAIKRAARCLRGFTIVEVTIAAALSTILIAGVFAILLVSNKQLQIINAKMSIEEEPREALFKMAQELRQTSSGQFIGFGTSGTSIQFRVPVPKPDASTLVNNTYDPLWAAYITYSLNTNTHQILRTSVEDGVTKQAILANNVTSLSFSRANSTSSLVTIQIHAQQTFSDGRKVPAQPILLTTEAETRNP